MFRGGKQGSGHASYPRSHNQSLTQREGKTPTTRGDFYKKAAIRRILSTTQNRALALTQYADAPFPSGCMEAASKDPEESSRLLCGEHGVSRPTGARQAFSTQNSSPKVLTVATTQNVALASWSNNYFASFWLRTASMQSTAQRRSQMISISILLDLSKRGRWSARSSDLDSMLMTHTPRMCQNNNDARAPAWLGALGYDTGILFHSVFPSITSELKKKKKVIIFMCFSSDPFIHHQTQIKDSRKFTSSPGLISPSRTSLYKEHFPFSVIHFCGMCSPVVAQLGEVGNYIIYFCLPNPWPRVWPLRQTFKICRNEWILTGPWRRSLLLKAWRKPSCSEKSPGLQRAGSELQNLSSNWKDNGIYIPNI